MKKIIIPFSLIFVFISSILLLNKFDVVAKENIEENFTSRSYCDHREDNWIYCFKINYSDNKTTYIFNGYNLKYKELPGYSIPVKDKETGEVIEKIKPEYITLINSEKYGKELIDIRDYFNKKQFNSSISVDDIQDLNITVVNKDYLVDIFNKAILSPKEKNDGKYANAPFFGVETKESNIENINGKWQVAYLLRNGDIYDINIEFIEEQKNNTLSEDSTFKSSENYNKLSSTLNEIENEMIKNQSFNIDNSNLQNEDLLSLLDEVQKNIEK